MIYLVFFMAFLNGLVVEFVAYKNDFWRYRKSIYLLFNIVFIFTLVQGGIAFLCVNGTDGFSLLRLAAFSMIGSVFGVIYEAFNQCHTRLFDFGKNGVTFLKTKKQLIWGVGIAWGGVPASCSLVYWWLMQ